MKDELQNALEGAGAIKELLSADPKFLEDVTDAAIENVMGRVNLGFAEKYVGKVLDALLPDVLFGSIEEVLAAKIAALGE